MTIDGIERAPLVTDWGRWRRVVISTPTSMAFHRMDDSFVIYGAKVDTAAKSIDVTSPADKSWKAHFAFQQPAPDVLLLDGEMDGRKVHMETRLFDRNRFLLMNRGFNWIQERPFNR